MLDKIKQDLLEARKNDDKVTTSILRLVVSECELEVNRGNKPNVEGVIKKLLQSNNDCINVGKQTMADNLVSLLEKENKILSSYLPKYLTKEEIQEHLKNLDLGNNMNKNMGTAIKYFKGYSIAVEPKDVLSVLETLDES